MARKRQQHIGETKSDIRNSVEERFEYEWREIETYTGDKQRIKVKPQHREQEERRRWEKAQSVIN